MDETLRDLMAQARDYARTYSGRGSMIMEGLVRALERQAESIARQNSNLEVAHRMRSGAEAEADHLRNANAALQVGLAENARARRDLELLRRIVLGQEAAELT
jgi:hypothetical protein